MKHLLLDLLERITPSRTIISNCLALINREQVGVNKYGQTLPDSDLTHEQLLQHAREEMLDGANYLEAAIQTARNTDLDHRELLGLITIYIDTIGYRTTERGYNTSARACLSIVRDDLKELLHKHETARTLRALRNK